MEHDYFVEHTLWEGFRIYKENFITLMAGAAILGIGSVLILTAPPLLFGFYYMVQKMLGGEKAEARDIFRGFDYLKVSWKMAIEVGLIMLAFFLLFTLPTLLPLVEQIPWLAPLFPYYDLIPDAVKEWLAKFLIIGVVFILAGSLISFAFPAMIIFIVFQYAIPIAITEEKGAFSSLNRSFLVARKHMAYSLILFLLLLLLWGIVDVFLAAWMLLLPPILVAAGMVLVDWLLLFPYTVVCLSRAAQKVTEK